MADHIIPDENTSIVLASSSPRRIELLKNLGLNFRIIPSNVDETFALDKTASDSVIDLARMKARAVMSKLTEEGSGKEEKEASTTIVLGADTTVVLDGELLGKPDSIEEARAMLQTLSGRRHEVYTGVALIISNGEKENEVSSFELSNVFFRNLTFEEICAYVDTGEPMDKAGGYALQGIGSAFVQKIEGCFTNVIGLPIPLVVSMFRRAGISILGTAGRH